MTEIQTSETSLLSALPVAVYTTDADGRLTWFNEAAARLWGRSPELGATQWCGSWKLYWPDGRPMPAGDCALAQTLKLGEPVRGVEAIMERPDGSRVSFLPHPGVLTDASGAVSGTINVMVEIPGRKDGELEAAHLAAIVSSSNDAIVSKRLDGTITSWNSASEAIARSSKVDIQGRHLEVTLSNR